MLLQPREGATKPKQQFGLSADYITQVVYQYANDPAWNITSESLSAFN